MTKLAFIGLGRMGSVMAGRLVEAGHDVAVWNRTSEHRPPLVEMGARAVATPAKAVADRELVITMLSTPAAVREMFLGPDDAAPVLRPSTVVAKMSTIGCTAVRELRAELPNEVALLDAPVLGSTPQAAAGQLHIFVGGPEAGFDVYRDVFEALDAPSRVGPLGTAAALKLAVNIAIAPNTVINDALALADRLDLGQNTTFEALALTPLAASVGRIRKGLSAAPTPTTCASAPQRKTWTSHRSKAASRTVWSSPPARRSRPRRGRPVRQEAERRTSSTSARHERQRCEVRA
ncbi:NAD(P)-dependent oxidoreductase [Streptomyces nodosus]